MDAEPPLPSGPHHSELDRVLPSALTSGIEMAGVNTVAAYFYRASSDVVDVAIDDMFAHMIMPTEVLGVVLGKHGPQLLNTSENRAVT